MVQIFVPVVQMLLVPEVCEVTALGRNAMFLRRLLFVPRSRVTACSSRPVEVAKHRGCNWMDRLQKEVCMPVVITPTTSSRLTWALRIRANTLQC